MSTHLSMDGTSSNSNQSNDLYTYASNSILRAFHRIHEIPANVIRAWRNGSISQRCMVAVGIMYCTAATIYIIYLESQNTHKPVDCFSEAKNNFSFLEPIDCLLEFKRNPLLLDQLLLEDPEGLSKNYTAPVMTTILKRCESRFHESGAHESSSSNVIGMHICYPLINKICNASESMLQIMSRLEKIPEGLQENVRHIRRNFFCEKSSKFL